MDEEQKKISLPEIIIMVMIVAGADLFDVFVDLAAAVPVIGQILLFANWFVDIFVFAVVQFWLIIKGGIGFKKQATVLAGNLIEMIPFLDILPIRTTALLVAIYMINHPGIAEKLTPAGKAVK